MFSRRHAITLAAALTPILTSASTSSAMDIRKGIVFEADPTTREVHIDIGSDHGAVQGDEVRIKRWYSLPHPDGTTKVESWLTIAHTHIQTLGDIASSLQLDPSSFSRVRVQDRVEVLATNAPLPVPPIAEQQPLSPDQKRLLDTWRMVSSLQDLLHRILAWEAHQTNHSNSEFADKIDDNLVFLRRLLARLSPPVKATPLYGLLRHESPSEVYPARDVGLAFSITQPDSLSSAQLHYRVTGTHSYKRIALVRSGAFLRASIPAAAVREPGFEYFVEAVTRDGKLGDTIASARSPQVVVVQSAQLGDHFRSKANRSRVSATARYWDFDNLGGTPMDSGNNFYTLETDFLYRLDGLVQGIRVGFGVLDKTDDTSEQASGNDFNYGYTQVEFRLMSETSVAARLQAGVGRGGLSIGGGARIRFGVEREDNFSLGVSSMQSLGFMVDIRQTWSIANRYPLGFSIAVTDQPNNGQLGIILGTDIGFRIRSWLRPTLHISYQARSITHHGLGTGLGLIIDW